MSKLFQLVSVLFILVFISACSFEEKIKFNDDFSGSYRMTIDMKETMNVFGEMFNELGESFDELADSTEIDDIEQQPNKAIDNTAFAKGFMSGMAEGMTENLTPEMLDSIAKAFNISSLVMSVDSINYTTDISFDFPNLNSLSAFYGLLIQAMEEGLDEKANKKSKKSDTQWVYLSENKIIFKGDEPTKKKKKEDPMDEAIEEMMAETVTVSSEYTFPKKIKSTNHPFAEIDGNTVKISFNMKQMEESGLETKDIYFEF
jgi:hypothetical protein